MSFLNFFGRNSSERGSGSGRPALTPATSWFDPQYRVGSQSPLTAGILPPRAQRVNERNGLLSSPDTSGLYTSTVLNTSTKWGLALVLVASSLSAQVRVFIPQRHYQPQEQIPAKLENQTSQPITVCVEFGQWSPKGDTIESTPSPFFVERNDNGKWGVLLNGPDVGSNSQPVEVDSGKSLEFPFRLNGEGTMRLRLDYWIGSRSDVKCNGPAKDTKHLRSATFTLG
jgi:hypothetical protein